MADDPKQDNNKTSEELPWDENSFEQSLESLFDGVVKDSHTPPPSFPPPTEQQTISSSETNEDEQTSIQAPPPKDSHKEDTEENLEFFEEEDDETSVAVIPSLVTGPRKPALSTLQDQDEDDQTIVSDGIQFPAITPPGKAISTQTPFSTKEIKPVFSSSSSEKSLQIPKEETPPYGAVLPEETAEEKRTPPYGRPVRLPLPASLSETGKEPLETLEEDEETQVLSPRSINYVKTPLQFGSVEANILKSQTPAVEKEQEASSETVEALVKQYTEKGISPLSQVAKTTPAEKESVAETTPASPAISSNAPSLSPPLLPLPLTPRPSSSAVTPQKTKQSKEALESSPKTQSVSPPPLPPAARKNTSANALETVEPPTSFEDTILPPDRDEDFFSSAEDMLSPPSPQTLEECAKEDVLLLEEELLQENDPLRSANLSFEIGRLFEEVIGEIESARSWYEKALSTDPSNRLASRALRAIAERNQNYQEALDALRQEIEATSNPEEQAALLLDVAGLWHRLDAQEEEQAALELALKLAPEDACVLQGWLSASYRHKRWQDFTNTAIKFSEQSKETPLAKALLWEAACIEAFQKQNYQEAIRLFTIAENVGEEAAKAVKESLFLRQEDFSSLAREAAKTASQDQKTAQKFSLACLRAPQEEIAPLLLQTEVPDSMLQSLIALRNTDNFENLSTKYHTLNKYFESETARGAGLFFYAMSPEHSPETAQTLLSSSQELLSENGALCWIQQSIVPEENPAIVEKEIIPRYPAIAGPLYETHLKDESKALEQYIEALRKEPDNLANHYQALRLGILLETPEAYFQALREQLGSLREEEQHLRAVELVEIASKHQEQDQIDEIIAQAAQTNSPFASSLRAIWAATQPSEHLTERGIAYFEAADIIEEPFTQGALLAHAAHYLERAGDLPQAWEYISRSVAIRPTHTPSREIALHLAARLDDANAYRVLREEEYTLVAQEENAREAAAIAYEIGALFEEQTEWEKARKQYVKTLELYTNHIPAVQALSRLAMKLHDWEASAETLALMAEQRQEDKAAQASTFLLAAEIYDHCLDRPEFALEALERAREIVPNHRAATRAQEALLWRVGDKEALQVLYEKEVQKYEEEPILYKEYTLRLGRLAADRGDFAQSVDWYQKTLQKDPNNLNALLGLEQSALAKKLWPELCQVYETLSQWAPTPNETTALEVNLIALRRKAGVGADALPASYLRLLEAAPSIPMTQRLALFDSRLRKDWEAEATISQSISRVLQGNPRDASLWKTRQAEALFRANRIEEAKENIEEAIALAPDYLSALWRQAQIAETQEDPETGFFALELLGQNISDQTQASHILLQAAKLALENSLEERARRSLWLALEKDPSNLDAFTLLRQILSNSSREDAVALRNILEKRLAVVSEEERPPLLEELARLCRESLQDPDGGRAALRELAKAENASFQTLFNLALLEEQQEAYPEATELFIRILRFRSLSTQQRRDTYWHLALIYDEFLPTPKRAIASFRHVIALGGVTEREAAFRLAKVLAKDDEKNQASDLFTRLALTEPDTQAKIQSFLRIARFWSQEQEITLAIAAALRALSFDEHNLEVIEELSSLYDQKQDKKAKIIHLKRAALSYSTLLQKNPARLELYPNLISIFNLLGEPLRANIAASIYSAFGGENSQIEKLAQTVAIKKLALEKITTPAIQDSFRHPDALSSLRKLLPLIGDSLLRKIFPAELTRHGVNTKDKLVRGPLVETFQNFAKALKVNQANFYQQNLSSHTIEIEHTSVPSIIVGMTLTSELSKTALEFLGVRTLYFIGQGPLFSATLGPIELRDLLFGIALALEIPISFKKTPRAEEISRLVGSAVSRKDQTLVSSLVLESLPGGSFSGETFSRGLCHEANRAALLLVGDIRAALQSLAHLYGGKLPQRGGRLPNAVSRAPEIIDLVQFLLSEDFAALQKTQAN